MTIPEPPPGIDPTVWLTMSWWQRCRLEKRLEAQARAEYDHLRKRRIRARLALAQERAAAERANEVLAEVGVDPDADQHLADLIDAVTAAGKGAA